MRTSLSFSVPGGINSTFILLAGSIVKIRCYTESESVKLCPRTEEIV